MNPTSAFRLLCRYSLLLWAPVMLFAEDAPPLCRPPPATELTPDPTLPLGGSKVHADEVYTENNNTLRFSGSVSLQRDTELLHADEIMVEESPRRIQAEGNIKLRSTDFIFESDTAEFIDAQDLGRFGNVEYQLIPRHAWGTAKTVERKANIVTLDDATYSTCNPGDQDWIIKAKTITLDQDKGMGTAKRASLSFKGLPFLYLPAASFPIDDQRLSGVLFPDIGNGDQTGLELSLPLYWNIAPQYDATLTPRIMSDRGIMFQNQFRYLGGKYAGKLTADYLNQDKANDQNRYQYVLEHRSKLNDNWNLELDGSIVSDGDYFKDFSNSLDLSSITHLERRADLRYGSRYLNALIRTQAYQTVDETIPDDNRPYRRLPQVALQASRPLLNEHANLSVESDITRFTHKTLVEGMRLDISPRLGLNFQTPGSFLKPAVSWRYTHYDLDSHADSPSNDIVRMLPVTTVDSGLIFEREAANERIQTLEPRLFYVRTPYRDQDDIPIFDTHEPSFIFSSLFRENRFSGIDRIGDTEQITAALSSRLIDQQGGDELLRASLGQIYYFDDREVDLPNETPSSDNRSDYVAELSLTPDRHWIGRGSVIADSDFKKTRVGTLQLGYRDGRRKIANIEHRFRRDDSIDQTNLSTAWPINRKWRFLGRWLYSHGKHRSLEVLAGLEYESCCWKARLVSRHFLLGDEEDYNNSISFQLVLKGLTAFGKSSHILENSILGYEADDE
ncbi:MAG: LPS-assembly protein LptD [Thiothrix sp.]|nr:MAG: LPS-assembly protein LptD [Thiothrix sp.]